MYIALSKTCHIHLLLIPCNPSWPSPHINVSHSPRIWTAGLCFSGRLLSSHKTPTTSCAIIILKTVKSYVRLCFYRFRSCIPAGLLTISKVWKIYLSGQLGICPERAEYLKYFFLCFKHSFSYVIGKLPFQ